MSDIITGGMGGHGGGSAGWHAVFGYGGHLEVPPLCLLRAENGRPGEICFFFSADIRADPACTDPRNYRIVPLPGYEDRPITLVSAERGSDRVCFTFTGGPGAYRVTVSNVTREVDGVLIDEDCDDVLIFIGKPGVVPVQMVRIFDTVLGPMGLRQINVGIQTVEDLLQQRVISQGVTAQLDNVIAELGPAGSTRDDSRIPFLRIR
jgi:hypothetical protein